MEMETGRVSCWLEKNKCCSHLHIGQEVCLGKHRADEPTLGPGEIMEQVLLEDDSGPVKGKAFWCLINLFAFYDRINGFVDDGKVVIYFNINKAFDIALEYIFVSFVDLSTWTIKQSPGINSGI